MTAPGEEQRRALMENDVRWQVGVMAARVPGAVGGVTLSVGQNQVKCDVLLDPTLAREMGEALIASAAQAERPVSGLVIPDAVVPPDVLRGRG